MSKSITIRDVPDDACDELAARARRSGRSLQEYLRATLVDIAERPDPRELMAEVRRRTAATHSVLPTDRILELLEGGRR